MKLNLDCDKISVLDHGYVRLVDKLGSDLTVVNSARVSYDKESFELTEQDKRLIRFLAREGHTSPFRHAMIQFEVYAPLMVARQWWKYCIGSAHQDPMAAWNESSRRYITEEPVFYMPTEWRTAPSNSKQGSGEPVSEAMQIVMDESMKAHIEKSIGLYEKAIENGVCAEQARLFLPAYGLYVRWYWTTSLQGACHFLNQRLEHDAQKEIQEYAKAVLFFVKQEFPESLQHMVNSEG